MCTADHCSAPQVRPRVPTIGRGHAPGVGVAPVHGLSGGSGPRQLRRGVRLDTFHHVGLDIHLREVRGLVLRAGVSLHVAVQT